VHDKEGAWITRLANNNKQYGRLYARLLRRWPPKYIDGWPYGGGLWSHLRIMILGVPVRESFYCYPIARDA